MKRLVYQNNDLRDCHCRRVDPYDPYRPSTLHDSSDNSSTAGSGFSRNVPLRRTVHTVPMSVYQSPDMNQGEISPASTPQCSHFRCATSSRSHGHHEHPSFFGRIAAKFGRRRYRIVISVKLCLPFVFMSFYQTCIPLVFGYHF